MKSTYIKKYGLWEATEKFYRERAHERIFPTADAIACLLADQSKIGKRFKQRIKPDTERSEKKKQARDRRINDFIRRLTAKPINASLVVIEPKKKKHRKESPEDIERAFRAAMIPMRLTRDDCMARKSAAL